MGQEPRPEQRVQPRVGPTRCPYCHDECQPEGAVAVCQTCLSRHHDECWREGGSCASCGGTAALRPSRSPSPGAERAPARLDLPPGDPAAREALLGELRPEETLLWAGRPLQGVVLRASDAFLIPFSLLWLGFAIFWEGSVVDGGAPVFFAIWGLPFILVGFYLVFGRFFFDAERRRQTSYALTEERLILRTGGLSPTTHSFDLAELGALSLTTRHDGSGSIAIGPPGPGQGGASLEEIPHAQAVHAAILAARAARS